MESFIGADVLADNEIAVRYSDRVTRYGGIRPATDLERQIGGLRI